MTNGSPGSGATNVLSPEATVVPLVGTDAGADGRAGAFVRAFILRGAKDVKRKLVVERHVIELPGGLIVIVAPVVAAVDGNHSAAVVADQQNLGIARD